MKPLVCAFFLLTLALPAGGADDKLPETPWYPLRVGSTWHYKAGDAKFLMRVTKHEKVGDVLCAHIETVKGDKVLAIEHVTVTKDGVYRYDIEIGKQWETPKPPLLLLPLPPKMGDTFTVDSKTAESGRAFRGSFKISEEEIKVGGKTYKTVVVSGKEIEILGLKLAITNWYAENVGLVKQVVEDLSQKVEVELEKFEPGK